MSQAIIRGEQKICDSMPYPLVYGVLALSVLMIAVLASRLAKPLQPAFRWGSLQLTK